MNGKITHALVTLAAALLLAAVLLLPSRAAGQEARLLFRVTFDDLTANAQVAQGNPKSSLDRNLSLTAKEGFNKKTALLLGDGEQCAYEIKDNLNLSAGTISLWAKPHNWNDSEGRFGRENTRQLRGNKWWYMDTLDDVAWRVEYVDHARKGRNYTLMSLTVR